MKGTYKLTADFKGSKYTDPINPDRIVRDINFTPDDKRLPDVAICRVFSSRDDAELILDALRNGLNSLESAAAAMGRRGGLAPKPTSAENGKKGGRPRKTPPSA